MALAVRPKPFALEDLPTLSRDQLAWLWERTYGCPPPKGVRRGLLERSAAWHLQAKRNRRLAKTVTARMTVLIKQAHTDGRWMSDSGGHGIKPKNARSGAATSKASNPKARALKPGVRLVREWNGRSYVVDVVEDGFVLDGRSYRSLSALAFHITGAHWSGPRFFGL